MEKMGWQNGKGLGAKENGMTENIKVKFKMDTKGVLNKSKNLILKNSVFGLTQFLICFQRRWLQQKRLRQRVAGSPRRL
jgi:hypothetical protein